MITECLCDSTFTCSVCQDNAELNKVSTKFTNWTYLVGGESGLARKLSYHDTWNLLTDRGCDNLPLYGNAGLEATWIGGCGEEIEVSFWDKE